MTTSLQIGHRTVTATEIMTLLAGYQMLPQLRRELVTDQAIAAIELTESEQALAREHFDQQHQLFTSAARQAWLEHYSIPLEQLEALITRPFKIEKFKRVTWESQLASYFLSCKSQLDQVIYSLLRTKELEVAQELYFRIQDAEESFAKCACTYSLGPEAQSGGRLGPMPLSQPHPMLAKMLSMSQPGQLWPPTRLGEWFVIVRLEQLIPAQLDEPMQQHLLDRLFASWLDEQMHQLNAIQFPKTPQALVAA